ncbi:MAG: phosphotransferase family protein [Proteobacteria bacterium]|nr:MAG: phosphotransferase family protein [Pseudomonadota bacterium]
MSEQFTGTVPVQEKHRFDVERLADYLSTRLDGFVRPLTIEQFAGGQSNPTFLLITPAKRYVLRRKPPGKLLPSAHAVDREFRVISALQAVGIPVARPYLLCEDDTVIGTAFYVMDYVHGRVIWDQSLPGMDRAGRAAIYDEMNRVIAALHQVDYVAAGLADYGRPGNYLERQIGRWTKQYRASETEKIEAMERLIDWLPAHIPAQDETAIVHGDYRLDNVIFHATAPRIVAVLDWELSTLGHPLADFSYHCMSWRLEPGRLRGLAGLDLVTLGIPTEAEYVASYCRRTGRASIPHWDFYMAYNLFRLAGICQGIMGRVVDGTAANPKALESGRRARPLAEAGWKQVEIIVAKGG